MSHESRHRLPRPVLNAPGGVPVALSRFGLLALAVAFLVGRQFGLSLSLRVQAAIYLFGMVAMNLPHGGYEHFDNLRRRALSFQGRYVAAYLLGIALFAGLLFVAPVAGLALAVTVAMAKGGFGGVQAMEAIDATDHLRTRPQRWLAAAVRGGAVMLVPMVFWPETFYEFSTVMVSVFEPGALSGVVGDVHARRLLVGGGYASLVLAHLGLGYWRRAGTGSFATDAGETLLLIGYFAAVPVVVAVGLYFPLWYSARQVGRTTAVDDEAFGPEANDGLLAFLESDDPRTVALGAWGVLIAGSVATFGLAALLWTLSPNPLGGAGLLPGLVAFWSIFISIVALPHVVVGAWLDRDRGIWYVP
jgi:Brp/Blh family beta-carotene 15,15'-monooxygenase